MEKLYEMFDAISKRLSNPILISFAISWLAINYKAILVVLQNEHYKTKFSYLEGTLYAATSNPDWRLWQLPAIAASTYVLLSPLLSLAATAITGWYEVLNEKIRMHVMNIKPLDRDQAAQLKRELAGKIIEASELKQEALTSSLDSAQKFGNSMNLFGDCVLPMVFKSIQEESMHWTGELVQLNGMMLDATDEQRAFNSSRGIPRDWLVGLDQWHPNSVQSARSFALLAQVSEKEALLRLVKLTAIGMLTKSWSNDNLQFSWAKTVWPQQLGLPVDGPIVRY